MKRQVSPEILLFKTVYLHSLSDLPDSCVRSWPLNTPHTMPDIFLLRPFLALQTYNHVFELKRFEVGCLRLRGQTVEVIGPHV